MLKSSATLAFLTRVFLIGPPGSERVDLIRPERKKQNIYMANHVIPPSVRFNSAKLKASAPYIFMFPDCFVKSIFRPPPIVSTLWKAQREY